MIFHRYCVALVCTYQKLPIFFKEAETLLIILSDSLKSELHNLEVSLEKLIRNTIAWRIFITNNSGEKNVRQNVEH